MVKVDWYVFIFADKGLSIDLKYQKSKICTQMDHHLSSMLPLPQHYHFFDFFHSIKLNSFSIKNAWQLSWPPYNFTQAILSPPYNYHSTFLVQTLQCLYVDSTNHHGESSQHWCSHSSTTLCHSYWHATSPPLVTPLLQTERKRNKRIFYVPFFHLLLFLLVFSSSGQLDLVSKLSPS